MSLRTLMIGAMLATQPPAAAGENTEAMRALEATLPQWLQDSGTPSAAVAWVANGDVQWTLVVGEKADGIPADAQTLYNVASLTKPVTAEVALRAAASGHFSLDAPMVEHWIDPDLAADPRSKALTARLCLSHQCGFPNWRHDSENGTLAIAWPPGTQASYSGEGYEYVGHFLQSASGESLQAQAHHLLFKPAGMKRTSYLHEPWFEGHVAIPRGPNGESGTPVVRTRLSAADDLHTTIGDFAQFTASVLRGEGLTSTLAAERWQIEHDIAAEVCRPGRLEGAECPTSMGFALGWMRFDTPTDTVFFHGGGDWGERAFVLIVPARRIGIVVLTNGAGGMAVIRDTVAALYVNPAIAAFLRMQAGG
jgi:CubicO group peptidase (beta-lactamase class C family)